MSRNPYVDLCARLQALRRLAEEARSPLTPALGVAGLVYTHQIANVLRVLTDVRVRHLLADEVGLGKTVQALMILNALRRQRRDLRALIVVPDRLVHQWRDELLTRAHTAPFEAREPEEGQYVRLAWEEQLRKKGVNGEPLLTLGDIDPSRHHVLIVDELHELRADLQDRIVRAAAEFQHVLILTATPSFQHPARHAQLFALLEPERVVRASWEVVRSSAGSQQELSSADDLSRWPEWAVRGLLDVLLSWDQSAAEAASIDELSSVAMARCAYRRVIRTRRVDYRGVLPQRRHHPVVVEPLGAEVERQALMWRYFSYLSNLSVRFDGTLLAKRVILSPPSLEQRVDFFRRKGHERAGLLERVKPLVHRSNGDSRADALVDLLAAIWARSIHERVLVAAQDNLTVDYLYELVQARLPEVGPLSERVPLVAARVRQGMATDAVDDLAGFGNETSENIEAFTRGEAQVLFAPEAAQVGLNLQRARVVVLYSVPWRPEEVEQWIGRLDRIGNRAALSEDGDAKTIDVYTIAQRGLVDEKVVTVLQQFHVFERGVNLDGGHLREITDLIESAALRPDAVDWRALEEKAAAMAAADAVQELQSPLRAHLPWDVRWAKEQRARLDAMPSVSPILQKPQGRPTGPTAWDQCVEPIFKLLSRAGDYSLRKHTDPETQVRFRTLWYQFGAPGMYGRRPVMAHIKFGFGEDPSHDPSPKHAHAFITRRGDIESPPQREVLMELGHGHVRRPLRFANFGDALHDELIDGWAQPGAEEPLNVTYFKDHALWQHAEPGCFVLRMTLLDPAEALAGSLEEALKEVMRAIERSPAERFPDLIVPFKSAATCALEADARWLRALLPASAETTARWLGGQGWRTLSEEGLAALVNPMAHGRAGLPHAVPTTGRAGMVEVERELSRLRSKTALSREVWGESLPALRGALRERVLVVEEEAKDAVLLAQQALARAEAAVVDAAGRGNRAQLTRAERLRDAAYDTARMAEVYWHQRTAWLLSVEDALFALRPSEQLCAVIFARRGAD
jgi:ATP-dependent helicase HepA